MKVFIYLVILFQLQVFIKTEKCECGNRIPINSRIVGGIHSKPNAYPWLVYLQINLDGMCAGSLITDRHVLTAAHCLYDQNPENIIVLMGVHNVHKPELTGQAEELTLHEDYKRYTEHDDNDIGMILLRRMVDFNERIRPACLTSLTVEELPLKSKVTIAGWGLDENKKPSKTLREIKVKIVSPQECQRNKVIGDMFVPNQTFCTYAHGKDSCAGDSGGPVMLKTNSFRQELIGLVSYGKDCAMADVPSVNVHLAYYMDWIIEHSSENSYCSLVEPV